MTLGLFAAFMVYRPLLTDYWTILDDMRHHIYWTVRYQDSSLFQNDLLTQYFSRPGLASMGMNLLYRSAGQVMEPLLLSRLLPLLLIPLTIWSVFHIGLHLGGKTSAWTLTCMLLVVFFGKDLYAGGLARSFYHTLLIPFTWALMRERRWVAGLLLVLTAVWYPPAMLVGAATWMIHLWSERAVVRANPRSTLLPPAAALILCAVIILPTYLVGFNEGFGALISEADARTMPEFSTQGRLKIFQGHVLLDLFFGRIGVGLIEPTFTLIGIAGWMSWVLKRDYTPLPTVFRSLLFGSFGCFIAARLTLFHLYEPSRYMYMLPVVLAVFAAANMPVFAEKIAAWWRRYIPANRPWHIIAILLVLLAASNTRRYGKEISTCDIPEVCEFLATLPTDAVIAGWPTDMDWVPLYSKRIVLINYELSGGMHYNYMATVRERTHATFEAFYAADDAPLRKLRQQFGVTHFIVKKAYLTKEFIHNGKFYYQPFNDWLQGWLKPDSQFFLRNPPPPSIIWENETHQVVDLEQLTSDVL